MSNYLTISTGCGQWGNKKYYIPDIVVNEFFPQLPLFARGGLWSRTVELRELVDPIHFQFPAQNPTKIAAALKSFFGYLKDPRIMQNFNTCIGSHIQDCFTRDAIILGLRPVGLPNARCNFIVLAAFAEMTASTDLAGLLLSAFEWQRKDVLDHERDDKLWYWLIALDILKNLADPRQIDRCMRYLSRRQDSVRHQYRSSGRYDPRMEKLLDKMDRMLIEIDRGRNYNHGLAWPRARTLPPPAVRAVPMIMPAAPAWASAYNSPALRTQDDYFRDAQVYDLEDRVARLEYNEQVQMGLPSPVPMAALPWNYPPSP